MTAPFDGRVALVTGAGRGIGRATALQLANGGARLALVARSVDQLEETAETVRAGGGLAVVLAADLAETGSPAESVARAVRGARPGRHLDQQRGGRRTGRTDAFRRPWNVVHGVGRQRRRTGPAHPGRPALDAERGWGRIVNVSTGIVDHPGAMVGLNAYAATKAALEAHTLNLAAELAGSGITVNVYRPGSVNTAMQAWIRSQPPEQIGAALHDRFQASYEQGALITPERSARSLLARLADGANGEIWSVNDA